MEVVSSQVTLVRGIMAKTNQHFRIEYLIVRFMTRTSIPSFKKINVIKRLKLLECLVPVSILKILQTHITKCTHIYMPVHIYSQTTKQKNAASP